TIPPQPSGTAPQLRVPHAAAASIGAQPQTFAIPPPPQLLGAVHNPALQRPPQPSLSPHALPPQFGMQVCPPPPPGSRPASAEEAPFELASDGLGCASRCTSEDAAEPSVGWASDPGVGPRLQ